MRVASHRRASEDFARSRIHKARKLFLLLLYLVTHTAVVVVAVAIVAVAAAISVERLKPVRFLRVQRCLRCDL